MRAIGTPFSPPPAGRALLAGAALLLGAIASTGPASAQKVASDETAMALPRLPSPRAEGVALPAPLAPSEAARIRRILGLQSRGAMAEASREMALLSDTTLNGPLLAQRYLGPHHRSTSDELQRWLAAYSDQPDAPAIHALLLTRLPPGATPPPAPALNALPAAVDAAPEPEDTDPGAHAITRNALLDRTVFTRASEGHAASALHLIARTKSIRVAYAALLRAEVAQVLFTRNEDAEALAVATAARPRGRDGETVGLAGFIAGLAAWRLDLVDLALPAFEEATRATYAPSALRAAAAFWAARAHMRLGDSVAALPWLRRAAQEKRTFYGLLARHRLGLSGGLEWERETLGGADVDAIAATPQGARAFALLQVGQPDRAAAELRLLWPTVKDQPPLRHALLLVARDAGFTDMAAQMAGLEQAADGKPRDADRFPVPRLRPRNGFLVDPALVYALTRLESNFDADATSPVGARGLMQLMPVTAGYIVGDPSLDAERLHDPAFNLELGQRYVRHLASLDGVAGNLVALLASYNCGPGCFARWAGEVRDGGDPLLFIEAIPVPETRAFVQHVLAYTWIYAARLHLPALSLQQIAAGSFPRFTPLGGAETLRAKSRPH